MKITPFEREALRAIIDSEFHDCRDPVGDWVWTFSANPWNDTPQSRRFAGVMASLSKKGLAESDGRAGDEACVRITRAGFDAVQD